MTKLRGLFKAGVNHVHIAKENGVSLSLVVKTVELWKPTWRVWTAMHLRCRHHPNYRSKKICKRWNSFKNFCDDMGVRPSGKTIDRIDNHKGYSAGNCRWATRRQQARNRGNNRYIQIGRRIVLQTDCEKMFGVSRQLINSRVKSGWALLKAATTPPRPWRKK